MRMHALLEWRHGRVGTPVDRADRPDGRWWARGRSWWGTRGGRSSSASAWPSWRGPAVASRAAAEVATLVEARNVVWAEGQPPIAVNDAARPRGRSDARRGRSGSRSIPGPWSRWKGPPTSEILSGMRLRAVRGRITARMKGEAKGFTVETPSTLVVDQGTEFGVEVDASGRTGVVVFQGLVDLSSRKSADGPRRPRRLGQGEGDAGRPGGRPEPDHRGGTPPGDDGWSTGPSSDRDAVIRSVRDNIRGLESSKYYQIVHRGLDDDAPAYVDRPHEWNGLDPSGLPGFLRGADYVMPFNDDKWTTDLEITVELARAATLYVFLDDREKPPAWLTERFTDTGVNIGLDEGSWPDPDALQRRPRAPAGASTMSSRSGNAT